jgi:hypothetical protein
MIWVLIRLCNFNIVWWHITYMYIATCFGRTTIIRLKNIYIKYKYYTISHAQQDANTPDKDGSIWLPVCRDAHSVDFRGLWRSSPLQNIQSQQNSCAASLMFLHLCTSWRWLVSFTPLPLRPRGMKTWYPLDRSLGGPQIRAGRYAEVNILDPTGIRTWTFRSSSL